VRIGEGWISLNDVDPRAQIKFQTGILATGNIVAMELAPRALPPELRAYLPPKKISVTINTVPQGAELKVDGRPSGTTPKIIEVVPGKHELSFTKEGFNPGTFPLEITLDDVSGGSVSYEFGGTDHDTIELRDGSVLSGDVLSVSATEAVIRVGGTPQTIKRNQVKRISLVQRNLTPE
jgi:hypothetical protein